MTVKHIFPPEFITVILKGDTVISLHRILQLKKKKKKNKKIYIYIYINKNLCRQGGQLHFHIVSHGISDVSADPVVRGY